MISVCVLAEDVPIVLRAIHVVFARDITALQVNEWRVSLSIEQIIHSP